MELLIINSNNQERILCLMNRTKSYYTLKKDIESVQSADNIIAMIDKAVNIENKELIIELDNDYDKFFSHIEEILDTSKCITCKYFARCLNANRQ